MQNTFKSHRLRGMSKCIRFLRVYWDLNQSTMFRANHTGRLFPPPCTEVLVFDRREHQSIDWVNIPDNTRKHWSVNHWSSEGGRPQKSWENANCCVFLYQNKRRRQPAACTVYMQRLNGQLQVLHSKYKSITCKMYLVSKVKKVLVRQNGPVSVILLDHYYWCINM